MSYYGQSIVPAIKNMADFEEMLESPYQYGVFLDLHVAQLRTVYKMAEQYNKKMFLHADLIQGLKNDEYAAEFLSQEIKPYGLISTKASVILKAKQKGVRTMQRIFILDSNALKRSVALIKKTEPDYIEVLPGVIPKVIKEIRERTGRSVFAGGLIDSIEEVEQVIAAGAVAITTSNKDLWNFFSNTNKF